jgi:hypothetical protein
VTSGVWDRICERLLIDISKSVHPRFSSKQVECEKPELVRNFKSNSPLDGIISYLTSRFGGNISDMGIVLVTSKSVYNPSFTARNAVDLMADSKFISASGGDQWLCYDFRDRRVEVRHSAIRSLFNGGLGCAHPKSWVIERSVDGHEWIELDQKRNNPDLNDRNVIRSWPTTRSMKSRYIRLRLTGRSHCGTNILALSSFEVFGTIIE